MQHELARGSASNVGYFRRWYGNFIVTDNRAVTPADFGAFSITAPVDPRLPDGGGYTFRPLQPEPEQGRPGRQLLDVREQFRQADRALERRRLQRERQARAGIAAPGRLQHRPDVDRQLRRPGAASGDQPRRPPYCHVDTAFLTQVEVLGTYTIPKVDVQSRPRSRACPGRTSLANYVAPNASCSRRSAGRCRRGANVTVNLVEPGTMYGERLNQLDLRFAKMFRFGRPARR